jgi:hypothetical protein
MTDNLSSMNKATFCARNQMSQTKYLGLKIKPRTMWIDGMERISIEAEADWRRTCEEAATSPEAIRHRKKLAAIRTAASHSREDFAAKKKRLASA